MRGLLFVAALVVPFSAHAGTFDFNPFSSGGSYTTTPSQPNYPQYGTDTRNNYTGETWHTQPTQPNYPQYGTTSTSNSGRTCVTTYNQPNYPQYGTTTNCQ